MNVITWTSAGWTTSTTRPLRPGRRRPNRPDRLRLVTASDIGRGGLMSFFGRRKSDLADKPVDETEPPETTSPAPSEAPSAMPPGLPWTAPLPSAPVDDARPLADQVLAEALKLSQCAFTLSEQARGL